MSAPAVASATLTCYGFGACPKCSSVGDLYGLCVSVTKEENCRHQDVRMCLNCLCEEAPSIRIEMSDVLELNTKSQRRSINKKARKRERACAKEISGSTTPASGSGVAKGDARNDYLMVDDKFTKSKQFTLRQSDVLKIMSQAKRTGRIGALKVGLSEGSRVFNVAVLGWDDFMEMIDGES